MALVFIGKHAIQDGKTEIAKEATCELVSFIEDHHPRFMHFEFFFSEDGSEMTVVQIHPDEESLALHMDLARERIMRGVVEFLGETKEIQIFGDTSPASGGWSSRWRWVRRSPSVEPSAGSAGSHPPPDPGLARRIPPASAG